MDKQLEELALRLFAVDAVKFGEFITKSGVKTPVYFDLRVIVSYPDIMVLITSLVHSTVKEAEYDHVCGVPYTALPIATLFSVKVNKSMLMRRKETKAYGTKKSIEGHFKPEETCLIIEDVITSGSSVLETVKDLQKEGLIVKQAFVILDREQGGRKNLEANDIQVISLFTMSSFIKILLENMKINRQIADNVQDYLQKIQAPVINKSNDRTVLPFEKRASLARNNIARDLFNIMHLKQTNLCLSVDLTMASDILALVEKVGQHICMVKTHVDIIEDFSTDFVSNLKQLAQRYNFLILEDRKFADIGSTVTSQHLKGIYRIGDWADCVTVHSLPGEGILKALGGSIPDKSRGVFLLAEMSSEGNLISPEYKEATVAMASKYPDLITGFVCQSKDTFDNPGCIQLTPGVQLETGRDDLGQIYNTPENVVLEKGGDVIVVGRGIVAAKDPAAQAVIYKDILWKCYIQRISGIIE